jgi:hypothetical protein
MIDGHFVAFVPFLFVNPEAVSVVSPLIQKLTKSQLQEI